MISASRQRVDIGDVVFPRSFYGVYISTWIYCARMAKRKLRTRFFHVTWSVEVRKKGGRNSKYSPIRGRNGKCGEI